MMLPNATKMVTGLALAAIAAAFLLLLFWRGFFDPDEGRYSEIPREMIASGRWLEMRMLDYPYYEKPPLSYWLVAPALWLFGAHDWAARIPLLFSALGVIAIFGAMTRRRWPDFVPLIVALTTVGLLAGTALLMTDAFLVFWFSLTTLALYGAFQPDASAIRRMAGVLVAAVSAAAGFLTKGAVAVMLPAGIVFLCLLWERRLSAVWTRALLPGVLMFTILLVPIMAVIERYNPGFLRQFMYEEHVGRFLGTRAIQLHPEPPWFFLMIIPLLLLPWTLFLPRAVCRLIRQRVFRTDSYARFLLVWTVVVVGVFSAGTGKLMSYILPAIVPMGLLLGRWGLAQPVDHSPGDRALWRLGVTGTWLLAAGIPVGWLVAYFQILPNHVMPVTGISALAFIPLTAGMVAGILHSGLGRFAGVLMANAGILLAAALLLSPLAGKEFNVLLHLNSSYVYKHLAGILKPEDKVVSLWSYRPALPFYTQKLYRPYQSENELIYGMNMTGRHDLHSRAELEPFFQSPGRVFGVIEPEDWDRKFIPSGMNYRKTDLPADRDTVIVELLPPTGTGKNDTMDNQIHNAIKDDRK